MRPLHKQAKKVKLLVPGGTTRRPLALAIKLGSDQPHHAAGQCNGRLGAARHGALVRNRRNRDAFLDRLASKLAIVARLPLPFHLGQL
jgi:hypothetical protein